MSFEEEAMFRWSGHIDVLRVCVKQMESGELALRSGVGSGVIGVTAQAIERDKATIKMIPTITLITIFTLTRTRP